MFIPALDGKQYYLDAANGVVWFSQADGAAGTGTTPVQVTHAYTFYSQYLTATELYLLQSGGLAITVAHGGMQKLPDGSMSVIFSAGQPGYMPTVVYYPSGASLTGTNTTSPPTATGTYTWYRNDAGSGIFQFYSGDIGQQVVITYPYLNPDYDTTAVSAQQNHGPFAIDFLQGTSGQAPPTGLSSKHPDQFANGALGYTDTAVAYQENGYLGTSGTLPSYSYEVIGANVVGGGTIDADPVLAMQSLLTDDRIGINFPAGSIDTKSWFTNANSASAWVNANKFYVSQAITNPTALSSIVGRWLEAFNIAAVWSEGLIKLVPYGDQSVSSASPVPATYTPDLTVVAQLTDDDFLLTGENQDPVKVTRSSWADAYNRVQVGYRNRVNAYNTDLVFEEDQGSIERFGLRIEGQQSLEFIATWQLAAAVANMRLKRYQSVRNTYAFGLPITYEYLEPMDLVSLTDTRLGLDAQVVRITKITNDPVKGLTVEAEDFPGNGYAMPTTNAKAATPALHPTVGTAPAGQTEIVIVQASNAQASSQTPSRIYVWMRGKDSNTWGSADLYRSLDGSNWELMSLNVPPAPIYTLTAGLPSVTSAPSGPLSLTHDSGATLSVQPATSGNIVPLTAGLGAWSPDTNYSTGNMVSYDARAWIARASSQGIVPTDSDPHWYALAAVTANAGSPPSVSDAAAANLQNLVAVVGTSTLEFLSYATVAAGTLTNTYNLTDLYRGALGTTPQAAPAGSVMVAFDSASATWDIPAGLAGQTIYFRYIARNARGVSMQTLEDAETIAFVVQAPGSGAAWDSLGGPIGDVIGDNAGHGQLNVNPAGGVKNELPHVNHSSQVQAVINGSSEIVSGTTLSASGTPLSAIDLGAVTGTQRNLLPDPAIKLGALGVNPYWLGSGDTPASPTVIFRYGPTGSNAFQVFQPATAWGSNGFVAESTQCEVAANQPYTASAFIDAADAGACLQVNYPGGSQVVAQSAGGKGRVQVQFTSSVGGQATLYLLWRQDHGAPAAGRPANFAAPQIEAGSVMTAYRESLLDDTTGGFAGGIPVFDSNGIASTIGDTTLGAVTGTQSNRIPDSGIIMPGTYWGTLPIGCTITNGSGQGPTFTFTASGQVTGAAFPVTAGKVMTLSGFIDATGCTAGDTPNWNIYYPEISQYAAGANQTPGKSGRVSVTLTIPAGVTKAQCVCGGTIHGVAYFNHPQLEAGAVMTAYHPNVLDDFTGGLNSGIQVQLPNGSLSSVTAGDAHNRVSSGFDGSGRLITGTVATPVAQLNTGASRANAAIDSGNVLVAGSADFARHYTNQHLGYMPDDPTTGRLARRSTYIGVGGTATWINLGTWAFPADGGGYSLRVEGNGGQGFNHGAQQQAKVEIMVRSGDGGVDNVAPNISGCTWVGHGNSGFVSGVKVISHGGSIAPQQNQWDVLVAVNAWSSAHWDFYADPKSSFATSGATTTDPGAASTTVVVGTGQYVHDVSANLYGSLKVNGTTKTPIVLQDLHDRVVATIGGYGGAGLGNVPDDAASSRYAVLAIDANRRAIIDGGSAHVNWTQDHLPPGANYGRTAITQLDASGNIVTLGTAGTGVTLNVGNGTMTPSTGGRQVKRFWVTQPMTGAYSNGQVFYFQSADGTPYLLDQGGAPLTAPDNAPYVALIPYGMTSPPQSFYASGVTNKQFTMNAYNGTLYNTTSTNLSNGVGSTYTVSAGDTGVGVNLSCLVQTTRDMIGTNPKYQNQTFSFSYNISANGGTVTNGSGTVPVVWNSDGREYSGSTTISCSVPAGDVITVNVSWGSHTDISSASASYTVTYSAATGATGVNFIAMIGESW